MNQPGQHLIKPLTRIAADLLEGAYIDGWNTCLALLERGSPVEPMATVLVDAYETAFETGWNECLTAYTQS